MGLVILVVLAGLALGVGLGLLGVYNGLIEVRNNVDQAWANIDVLLKHRHDELPKLIETCKQYMQYEQETLERVLKARTQVSSAQGSGDVSQLAAAEGEMEGTETEKVTTGLLFEGSAEHSGSQGSEPSCSHAMNGV